MKAAALSLFVLILITASLAEALDREDIDLSGYVDTRHSYQIKSPNSTLSSETRLRTECRVYGEQSSVFASVNAAVNHLLEDESGVTLHEGYLDYASGHWDIRAGRQIIIWGNADGLQITDIISPPDYTEYITRDLDEIRMPVDALKYRWLGEGLNLELIAIPVFKPGEMPDDDSPWAITPVFPEDIDVTVEDDKEPSKTLENAEIAGKLSFYMPGFDLALSYAYMWNDFPAMLRRYDESPSGEKSLCFTPEYTRLRFVGLEFSRPWGKFVFRGESAFYDGKYFDTGEITTSPLKKKSVRWLLGTDWYPGDYWTLTTQLTGMTIFDYDRALAEERNSFLMTLNISKKLFREKLVISNMIYWSINAGDVFDRFSIDVEIIDGFHIYTGTDLFHGEEDGVYGKYEDNSQVWLRARYSF